MQLKDIAKGLREAAFVVPSEPWYPAAIGAIRDANKSGRWSELRESPGYKRYVKLLDAPRLEVRLASGPTVRCLMAAEAVENLALRLERLKFEDLAAGSSPARVFRVDRAQKIATGARPPFNVLKDFIADGELENAREYAALTGSEAMLEDMLK